MTEFVIPGFLIFAGLGVVGIWTKDILSGKFSGQGNVFKWKEGEMMLWPHLLAEYLMAIALILGGIGMYYKTGWSGQISFVALGAIIYSAINSSGWVFAERNRISYGIPIWICLVGAIASLAYLI